MAQPAKEYIQLGLRPVYCRKCGNNRHEIGYKMPGTTEKKRGDKDIKTAMWCRVCKQFTFF